MSKTDSTAACNWNTHIGVTSGSPSAHVSLILKSNRISVPFPLACTHKSQTWANDLLTSVRSGSGSEGGTSGGFFSPQISKLQMQLHCSSFVINFFSVCLPDHRNNTDLGRLCAFIYYICVAGRRGMGIFFSPVSLELSAPLLTSQLSPLHFFFPLRTPPYQLCWLLRK